MQEKLLSVLDDGTILITAVFLEDANVLLSGEKGLQAYELDLVVSENITCDQLLGAIYAGLRDTLISRYHLSLDRKIANLAYRKEGRDRVTMRKAQAEAMKLRPNTKQGMRLRTYAVMYDVQARKIARMEEKYHFNDEQKHPNPQTQEKIGWIVSWQVFHECYRTYINGYPSDERRVVYGKSKYGVIARCSSGVCNENKGCANAWREIPKLWLSRTSHGDRKLRELGFHSGTKLVFDPVLMRGTPATMDETAWVSYDFHKEQVCDPASWVYQHRQSEFFLDAPSEPVLPESRDLIPTVLSPLVTTGAVMSAWFVSGASLQMESVLATAGTMVASTLAVSLINGCVRRNSRKHAVREWYEEYEQYVRHVIDTIRQHQGYVTGHLQHRHPPVWVDAYSDCLINRIANSSVNVFGFRKIDSDFLWARLGTTVRGSQLVSSGIQLQCSEAATAFPTVKYINLENTKNKPFRIVTGKVSEEEKWGYIKNLPADMIREYAYVENAPVGINLAEHVAVGVLLDDSDQDFQPILDNLLLDLCCNHKPEDLQVIWFFEETADLRVHHKKIQLYKHLPHMRQLFTDRSQFVFTRQDALQVMDRLSQICMDEAFPISERPHILVIFEKNYDLSTHPLSEVLVKDKGITTLFCCHRTEEVPDGCTAVIECDCDGRWLLLPGMGEGYAELKSDSRYRFEPDVFHTAADVHVFNTAFSRLAFLYDRDCQKGRSFEHLSFFQLLMDYCISCGRNAPKLYVESPNPEEQLEILQEELRKYVQHGREQHPKGKVPLGSLSVPIGNNRDGVVCMDLHAQGDGPHLLLLGENHTENNGALVTYLLSLCTHYEPDMLRVTALTVSGTEALQHLKKLPHVALVSIDGDGQAREEKHRLEVFLQALCTEVENRKQLLAAWNVSTVDEYNCALRNTARHRRSQNRFLKRENEADQSSDRMAPLSHRFIVLDDYQMLCALAAHEASGEAYDLDQTIAELIRLSNGLGIHFIISTAQDEQQLSKDLTGCISARLRLTGQSQEKGASPKGILGLFSGKSCIHKQILIADCGEDIVCRPCSPFRVTLAATQGQYSTFFDSEDYYPSHDGNTNIRDHKKQADDLIRNNPHADPRPGRAPNEARPYADPRPERVPNEARPYADPRPERMTNKMKSYAEVKTEETVEKVQLHGKVSGVRSKYKPADSIFYRPHSTGSKQEELLAEVLSRND